MQCQFDNNSNGHGWDWGSGERGKGPAVERELQLDDFTGISLNVSADVTLKEGAQNVVVSGEENIIDLLSTNVENGVWVIKFTERRVRNYRKLQITITIPTLDKAKINGSCDIIGQDAFSGSSRLETAINGSGNIDLEVNTGRASASINGSGDIRLRGSAQEFSIDINGSGDVEATGLEAMTVSVHTNGSGNAEVNATESLEVRISGSGDVRYRGNPRVNSRTSGSGSLQSI